MAKSKVHKTLEQGNTFVIYINLYLGAYQAPKNTNALLPLSNDGNIHFSKDKKVVYCMVQFSLHSINNYKLQITNIYIVVLSN